VRAEATPPVPAATLILIREAAGRLQVYLLRRSRASGFMPGSFVFPGGLVDASDGDAGFWLKRVDLAAEAIDGRLGEAGGFEVLPYAVAAVREAFEESQALLAHPRSEAGGAYTAACAFRAAHGTERGWFKRLVESEGWVLTLSALSRWERWVTPVAMPRRFDTRFFIAALPPGQICLPDMRETTEGVWLTPQAALAANLAGTVPLTPPGLVSLQELARHPTVASLKAAAADRRWSAGILPRLVPIPQSTQAVILMPWDPQYRLEAFEIVSSAAEPRVMEAGAPFSRVWNDGSGLWRPIGLSLKHLPDKRFQHEKGNDHDQTRAEPP
jgi:8-oxo-dGTP pyrophosphatase MutT (NUDIX family)